MERYSAPAVATGMLLLALSAPSRVTAQAPSESPTCAPPRTEVTGVAADILSQRPLPDVVVTLTVPATEVAQIRGRAISGPDGRYSMCVSAIEPGSVVIAQIDTLTSRSVPVRQGVEPDTLYLRFSQPVSIAGVVRISGTGQPVEGARVQIENRPVRVVTDDSGAFSIRGVGAGPLVIVTTHIGYAPRTDTIIAASGARIGLEIALGEEAVELEPIVITARIPPSLRLRGTHELGMTKEQVAEALPRSIDFLTMLRQANIPGLSVTPGGPDGPCIQFMRASGGCLMVQIFVNGNRISNGPLLVANLDPSLVSEFFVLRPAFAQYQYMGPFVQNGVLDIILR